MTLATFWQVSDYDFINFDDDEYVTENPHVKAGLTHSGIVWAFTKFHSNNWHPVTWISHMTDCHLFGLNPGMHHLSNVLIHTANSILLFLLFRWMTGNLWASAFVAALFALHPLRAESVAWVSERKDVLGAFFWMLTLLMYVSYTKKPGITRFVPVLLLFALGLMAKPMLVTLPFVLLLVDYWPLRRFSEKNASLFWEKMPLFALAAASSIVTVFAQKSGGLVRSLETYPLDIRIANALVSYIKYISLTILPRGLAFHYPYPESIPLWQSAGAALMLAGISVFVIRKRESFPFLAMGWFWYLGTLVPVIGFVQVATQALADRYTYIPSIGFYMMTAWGIPLLIKDRRHFQTATAVSALIAISGFAACTSFQLRHWKNSVTLFTHTLNVTENNYLAHNSLGAALEKQGNINEAVRHFKEALEIKPDGVQAHYNMGVALEKQGKSGESIHHFSESLRFKPDFADAHYNLGIALKRQGHLKDAIRHFSQAVEFKPDFAEAHNNLGNALSHEGSLKAAIQHLSEAVRLKPDYSEAYSNLGTALKSQGNTREAIQYYYKALRFNNDFAEAHFNLGLALGSQGNHKEAARHFAEAVRVRPDFADAHYSLGFALNQQGKLDEAMRHYKDALRLKPDFAEAHYSIAYILASRNQLDESVRHFAETVRIKPDYAEAHNNLGSALARQGKFEEAVKHFSEALRLKPNFANARQNLDLALEEVRGER
jgi:tetratricopeptide (TPR) repeat protein